MDQKLYDKGMELRRAVMGTAYVDRALAANQDDIGKPIQDFITEHGWGAVWGREGLDRKTRSMLNLAMLSILNRQHELRGHVRGASPTASRARRSARSSCMSGSTPVHRSCSTPCASRRR